jgi:hypothetical protein
MPPASDWSSKAGIDYRKPSFPAADFQPGALTAGSVPDQSNGVAWATVTAPGFQFPLGWDQTSIETRVDQPSRSCVARPSWSAAKRTSPGLSRAHVDA